MMTYCHRQRGILIQRVFLPIVILIPVLLLCLWVITTPPVVVGVVSVFVEVVLTFCLFLFHSLTVTVDESSVSLKFGSGIIKARFQLAEITGAKPVRNHWYDGWGFRLIDGGYMYNVSGLEAVEISLNSGAVHRIGTDEPNALTEAINNARRVSPVKC
jgi:hypothetical protein